MCTVCIEKTAAIRSQFLDDFLRSNRSLSYGLLVDRIPNGLPLTVHHRLAVGTGFLDAHRLSQLYVVIRAQILYHALRHQYERAHHAEWQEYPEAGADKINPEVSDGLHLPTRDPADKSDRQGYSYGGRYEIVVGKPSHLGEVTHRRFARVGLPIGVRGKRCCRIESKVGRAHRAEFLRIEGQIALQTLHRIEHDHRHQAEQEHRDGVLGPAHLMVLVDTRDPVEESLNRAQRWVHECLFAVEHTGHEEAQRLGNHEDDCQKKQNLKPTIGGHFRISPDATARRRDKSSSGH